MQAEVLCERYVWEIDYVPRGISYRRMARCEARKVLLGIPIALNVHTHSWTWPVLSSIPSCWVPSPGPRWHRGWGCGWHSSFLSPHSGLPCTFPFLAPERSPSLDSPHSRETFPTALEKLKVYPSWWVFAFSETTCLDPNRKTGVWNYFEQKILLPFLTYSWVSLLISPTYSVSKPEEQRLPAYWRSTSDLRFSSPRSHINSYRSPRDSCLTPLHIHTTDEVHMWNTFPNAACVVHLSTVSLLGCSL